MDNNLLDDLREGLKEAQFIQNMIDNAPDFCPITGLTKITSYIFDEGVVYGTERPLDAYTIPEYDEEEKAFYRIRIDMDNNFRREHEYLCDLEDLTDREDYQEIKKYYGIE